MTIQSLALAAALALVAVPAIASADTLHGVVHRTDHRVGHRIGHHTGHQTGRHTGHRDVIRTRYVHRGHGHPSRVHRVHVHRRGHCRYAAGHHVVRRHRVIVPGYHEERVIPARYEVRWQFRGRVYARVLVEPRRIVRDWVPERVEVREKRVWVPGRWTCS